MEKLSLKRRTQPTDATTTRSTTTASQDGQRRTGGNGGKKHFINKNGAQNRGKSFKSNGKGRFGARKGSGKSIDKSRVKALDGRITQEKYMIREDVQQSKEILAKFGDRFNFDDPKILSLDIHRVVLQINTAQGLGCSNLRLRKAITHYAHAPNYIKAYRVGAKRVDLFGKEVATVTQEEVDYRNAEVAKLREKMKARKKTDAPSTPRPQKKPYKTVRLDKNAGEAVNRNR